MVGSLLIYNLAVPALLIHAAVAYGIRGIALWPAGILHTIMAIWCVLCLRSPRSHKHLLNVDRVYSELLGGNHNEQRDLQRNSASEAEAGA